MATPSDEALGLLIMENSWEVWIEKHLRAAAPTGGGGSVDPPEDNHVNATATDGTTTAPKVVKTKYTMEGSGSREFKGWSDAGLQRMNQLLSEVKQDRARDKGAFDTKYKLAVEERKLGRKRKRGAQSADATTFVTIDDGWSDGE